MIKAKEGKNQVLAKKLIQLGLDHNLQVGQAGQLLNSRLIVVSGESQDPPLTGEAHFLWSDG